MKNTAVKKKQHIKEQTNLQPFNFYQERLDKCRELLIKPGSGPKQSRRVFLLLVNILEQMSSKISSFEKQINLDKSE